MEVKIRVYDEQVNDLLLQINRKARAFDPLKYGLTPDLDLRGLVYFWLTQNDVNANLEEGDSREK